VLGGGVVLFASLKWSAVALCCEVADVIVVVAISVLAAWPLAFAALCVVVLVDVVVLVVFVFVMLVVLVFVTVVAVFVAVVVVVVVVVEEKFNAGMMITMIPSTTKSTLLITPTSKGRWSVQNWCPLRGLW